jgi:hypothetical protein
MVTPFVRDQPYNARRQVAAYERSFQEGEPGMTIFRIIAIAMILASLGFGHRAEAGAAFHSAFTETQPSPVQQVFEGSRCPRLCVDWFDGCNTCSCGHGRADVCTHYRCVWNKRPRCLRHGF